MIGVVSKPEERAAAEEFFQLFKTPWEFFDQAHRYDVLIVTDQSVPETDAPLVIAYGAAESSVDVYPWTSAPVEPSGTCVKWDDVCLPIYGRLFEFAGPDRPILFCCGRGASVGYEQNRNGRRILRIGYDLFQEIFFLLTNGQPPRNALIPSLDLHISMLRYFILNSGVPLLEIPPVPAGFRFIACPTHDVDFIGIKRHLLDHSMLGFLFRASIGCIFDVLAGKASLPKLKKNLKAAFSVPFLFFGIGPDPWDKFEYCLQIENGFRSTFFFIPFKKRAGKGFGEGKRRRRAAAYDIGDAGDIIRKLQAKGCEIGVHGIDAWHSIESGREELARVKNRIEATHELGIRMHWLCGNEDTFRILDNCGYSYDSTMGYNEAVGFKAGTAQVFKPIGVKNLLEIPLHIQDTALFSPGRMNASEAHAATLCRKIIEHVSRYNGVLTILWHERSLGPERFWDDFYIKLIGLVAAGNAWIAPANEVADWFRMRRSVSFEKNESGEGKVQISFNFANKSGLPSLVLRQFRGNKSPLQGGPIALEFNDIVLRADHTNDPNA